jgi:hypothetical protein
MVVNFDADLYSSTKVRVGAYLYFDEFNDRHHELRAFDEFLKETGMKFKAVGPDQILSPRSFKELSALRSERGVAAVPIFLQICFRLDRWRDSDLPRVARRAT